MKATLSLRALADIEAIADHIAQDSRAAADRFSQQLLDASEDIGIFPERYPIVQAWEARLVRRRPYRNYSIFYVVREIDVLVLRVAHDSREYDRLFEI